MLALPVVDCCMFMIGFVNVYCYVYPNHVRLRALEEPAPVERVAAEEQVHLLLDLYWTIIYYIVLRIINYIQT